MNKKGPSLLAITWSILLASLLGIVVNFLSNYLWPTLQNNLYVGIVIFIILILLSIVDTYAKETSLLGSSLITVNLAKRKYFSTLKKDQFTEASFRVNTVLEQSLEVSRVNMIETPVEAISVDSSEHLGISDAITKHQTAVLLGGVGAGKTTALQKILFDIIYEKRKGKLSKLVPVLVNLNEYDCSKNFVEFIQEALYRQDVGGIYSHVEWLLKRGKLLLLLDGLNELPENNYGKSIRRIKEIIYSPRYRNNYFVFACRSHEYRGELDCVQLTLLPLKDNNIRDFLNKYLQHEFGKDASRYSEKLIMELGKKDLIEIARNPFWLRLILVSFITSSYQEPQKSRGVISRLRMLFNTLSTKIKSDMRSITLLDTDKDNITGSYENNLELPDNRGKLIFNFVERILGWIERKDIDKFRENRISRDSLIDVVGCLAYSMVDKNQVVLGLDQTRKIIQESINNASYIFTVDDVLDVSINLGLLVFTDKLNTKIRFFYPLVANYFASRYIFAKGLYSQSLENFVNSLKWWDCLSLLTGYVENSEEIINEIESVKDPLTPLLVAVCLANIYHYNDEEPIPKEVSQIQDGIKKILQKGIDSTTNAALVYSAQIAPSTVIPVFSTVLPEWDTNQKIALIQLLRKIYRRQVVPVLINLLADSNQKIVEHAQKALIDLRELSAESIVLTFFKPNLYRKLKEIANEIGPKELQELLLQNYASALQDNVISDTTNALVYFGNEKVLRWIDKQINEKDEKSKNKALNLLFQVLFKGLFVQYPDGKIIPYSEVVRSSLSEIVDIEKINVVDYLSNFDAKLANGTFIVDHPRRYFIQMRETEPFELLVKKISKKIVDFGSSGNFLVTRIWASAAWGDWKVVNEYRILIEKDLHRNNDDDKLLALVQVCVLRDINLFKPLVKELLQSRKTNMIENFASAVKYIGGTLSLPILLELGDRYAENNNYETEASFVRKLASSIPESKLIKQALSKGPPEQDNKFLPLLQEEQEQLNNSPETTSLVDKHHEVLLQNAAQLEYYLENYSSTATQDEKSIPLRGLADLFERSGQLQKAFKTHHKIVKEGLDFDGYSHFRLSILGDLLGKTDLNLSPFLRLVSLLPSPPTHQQLLTIGNIFYNAKSYINSIEAYERCLSVHSSEIAVMYLADAYMQWGDYEDALLILENNLLRYTESSGICFRLSDVYEKTKDYFKAAETFYNGFRIEHKDIKGKETIYVEAIKKLLSLKRWATAQFLVDLLELEYPDSPTKKELHEMLSQN